MYGEYTGIHYTLYTQHTMYVILYNLYIVRSDSQLYFDIILIGWKAYSGDQIHRKTCST